MDGKTKMLAAGIAGLALIAGGASMIGTAHADQVVTAWNVGNCQATGRPDNGAWVSITLPNCQNGRFQLTAGQTMSWTGYDASWYSPTVPPDVKLPSLDNTNSGGQVAIEFSKPITDPVLHIADLGGTNTNGVNPTKFTQKWTLKTDGLTLAKASGNSQFTVADNAVQITDVAKLDPSAGRPGDCADFDRDGLSYGCGSVRIVGKASKVVFDVELTKKPGCCAITLERTTFTVSVPDPKPCPPTAPEPEMSRMPKVVG